MLVWLGGADTLLLATSLAVMVLSIKHVCLWLRSCAGVCTAVVGELFWWSLWCTGLVSIMSQNLWLALCGLLLAHVLHHHPGVLVSFEG
jgi:hypothetical protein